MGGYVAQLEARLLEALPETPLIERAKSGETPAYEELVRRYQTLAFRTALVITKDSDEAEDATQSAFLKAYLHLGRFHPGAPFRPWLLRIVANEAKNRRVAMHRRMNRQQAIDETEAIRDAAPDIEDGIIANERSRWLVSHINHLRDDDRLVIYCRFVLDLSERDIASVMDCAPGTVKSRLHRAIGRLRSRIERDHAPVTGELDKERLP